MTIQGTRSSKYQGCESVFIWYGYGSSILGFDDKKCKKNYSQKFIFLDQLQITYPLASIRASKYKRSLKLSKKNIQHFKT